HAARPFVMSAFSATDIEPRAVTQQLVDDHDLQFVVELVRDAARQAGHRQMRLVEERSDGQADAPAPDLGEPVGVDVGTLDPATCWKPKTQSELLRAAIGTDLTGKPVYLDLKEAALAGSGPHGLVVGTTGSGKSEFLRTLLMSLVASHSPDELSLV